MTRKYPGYLITFEGPEGGGKTTWSTWLKEQLTSIGVPVELFNEPGSTEVGDLIRNILLDRHNLKVTPKAEALLFQASRAQIVEEKLKPALQEGKVVVIDRYRDSSEVIQGHALELGALKIGELNDWTTDGLLPDLTILLDLDPEVGLKRRKDLGEVNRIDKKDLEFHKKVREGYLGIARHEDSLRWEIIDASRLLSEIEPDVQRVANERLTKAGFIERQSFRPEAHG